MGMEDSIQDILARYEAKGFTGAFTVHPGGMLHCQTCQSDEPAAQAPLEALHRLEGDTDPSEQAVVAGIECPSCGAEGTLVLSYGPEASIEDMQVLEQLIDDRDQARITPGL